jgi:hypothetical protein
MSVELWKTIFDWATVVLIGLTFIAGAGALLTGSKISKRQAEQLRQFDEKLTGAQTELGKQQERAAKAEKALQEVANTAGEANERAGHANEHAARLEKEAETERLARVEIEAKVAWRRLTKEQQSAIGLRLRPLSGSIARLWYNVNDLEASTFALDLAAALHLATWDLAEPQPLLKIAEGPVPLGTNPPLETGVIIVCTPHEASRKAADAVLRELVGLGFDAKISATIEKRSVPMIFINVEHRPEGAQGEAKLRGQRNPK